jgi:hypothetical protein
MKKVKLVLTMSSIIAMASCGGGETAAENAENCVSGERVSGGAQYTNSCDFKVNVAVFNPIFRFDLEAGETEFLARTSNLGFGVCEAPSKPKQEGNEFFCD